MSGLTREARDFLRTVGDSDGLIHTVGDIGWLEIKVGKREFGTPGDEYEERKWREPSKISTTSRL